MIEPDFMTRAASPLAALSTEKVIGPFRPSGEGAMSVFRTREAAEAFARDDPFVTNGLVTRWTVHEWFEVLVPDA